MGTSRDTELQRYDAVVFFETAAVGGISIEGGNPVRIEGLAAAIEVDRRLRDAWVGHPRFYLIPHSASFMQKINSGLALLQSIALQSRAA
jgi:hypothetical protein